MSSPGSPIQGPVERTQMSAIGDVHISLPLDFREHLETIDSDITDSERESVRLTRKLNKRLSGSRTELLSSEYFLDRLSRWHNNNKVEKLKSLFANHIPKVKHIEDEVVFGATAVAANKVTVLRQAYVILSLVDKQIEYYQNHANFLDDVINDIRQCDFTLVREISEMKVAYNFSQELDVAARPRPGSSRTPSVDPKTVLLKIGVDSTGHVPGRRVLEDDAQVLSLLTSAHCGIKAPVSELLMQEPGVDIPILHLERSSKQKTLPTTTSTTTAAVTTSTSTSTTTTVNGTDLSQMKKKKEAETATEVGLIALSKSSSSDGSSNSSAHSISISAPSSTTAMSATNESSTHTGRVSPEDFYHIVNNNNPSTTNMDSQRDGADYKRKCLKSCSVNLQTLNLLNTTTTTGSSNMKAPTTTAAHSDCKSPIVTSPVHGMFRALGNAFQKKNDLKNNDEKRKNEKRRSFSVSSASSESLSNSSASNIMGKERANQEHINRNLLTKSASLGEVLGHKREAKKNSMSRTGSVGSSAYFASTTQHNSMKPPKIEVSQTTGTGTAPVLKLTHPHATTPRPRSYSSNTTTTSSNVIHSNTSTGGLEAHLCSSPHSTATAGSSGSTCLSPSTSAGIAFESQSAIAGAVRGTDRVLPPTPSTHPTTHSSNSSSSSQLAGLMSTSSSCSNLSLSSVTAAETAAERRRLKYAPLLAHCPQIYQSAAAQSEPGIRLLARKLNKCLKFKDELKRTLVKAELVQETENSCLCKMRKVQHKLQDLMVDEPVPSSGLYPMSASVSPEPVSLLGILPPGHTNFTANCSSTASESHDEHHHVLHTGHVRFSEESLCNAAVECHQRSAEFPMKQHPMFARLQLTDQELSSCGTDDDEHDHMTTGSYNSQHSHGNSSSSSYVLHHDDDTPPPAQYIQSPQQLRKAVPSECGVSTISTEGGHEDSTLGSHCRDPAIIDPSQDAAVNQISAELYELAHRCAQNLKELQDEEHDMASKLARVRQLLNSAHLIDTQLLTTLAPK